MIFAAWRRGYKPKLLAAAARCSGPTDVWLIDLVQGGDGVEGHGGELVGWDVQQRREVCQDVFLPGATIVHRQRPVGVIGVHVECPAVAGIRFKPAFDAAFAAKVDAAVSGGVTGVGNQHEQSVTAAGAAAYVVAVWMGMPVVGLPGLSDKSGVQVLFLRSLAVADCLPPAASAGQSAKGGRRISTAGVVSLVGARAADCLGSGLVSGLFA